MNILKVDCQVPRGNGHVEISGEFSASGITAVFGPNGAGKTTMMRMLAGLEDNVSGQIFLDDEVLFDRTSNITVPAHRRGVGLVFQDARLFDHLSVSGNLDFAAKRAHRTTVSRSDVIDAFDLSCLMEKTPSMLSGGERQRVAIARALLASPRILLMDEPLSAMDASHKEKILNYIEQIPERFSVPVFYITHSIDEAARICDSIILLNDGKVVTSGPMAEILSRLDLGPLTGRFEAGTVLNGIIGESDEEYHLTAINVGDQRIFVPRIRDGKGEQITFRIRARDVMLALEPPHQVSSRNVLKGTIAEIAAEPETAYAELRLELEGQYLRARVTRASVATLPLKEKDEVFAIIKSVSISRYRTRN